MTHPAPDPSDALEAVFRAVAARLRGLPVFNPALSVQAVGFRPWEGCWLGVLVTPWFMNLALTPREAARWRTLAVGAKRALRFPAGTFEFIGAHDPAFGEWQLCSLFSPMDRFADQGAAALVAELTLRSLFDPAPRDAGADAHADPQPGSGAHGRGPEAPTRRDVLRGRIGGGRGTPQRA